MAKINPTELSWLAPTNNTDGSVITEPLSYRLAVDGVDFLDFPGSLNADGRFYEDIAPMAIPDGPHSFTLKAFYVSQPLLISDPSGALDVVLGVKPPEAPLDFLAV